MSGLHLLPAAKGTCPECATAHEPHEPHNKNSITYQFWFRGTHGRWPTWTDAMAHCCDDMKEQWRRELVARGIDLDKP
jgi:hypothetical protein